MLYTPLCPGRRAARWNPATLRVGLLFGRDTAELGQRSHPPALTGELQVQSAGGTGEDGASPAPSTAGVHSSRG